MIYEAEAFKRDLAYCEHNSVVGIINAIAKKLNLDYKTLHDDAYKEIIHRAFQPLYQQFDRLVWRIEYLLRAIQDSTEGKNLTPEGKYLKKEYHQYLTTDGRIQAESVKFKRDFHSISLTGKDGETIGWANLSFEKIADLYGYLIFCLKRDYADLDSNIKEFERELQESAEDPGQISDPSALDDLAEMKKTLAQWKNILDKENICLDPSL